MRNTTNLVLGTVVLLATVASAHAQTTILNTIGDGSQWTLDSTDTNVRFLGADPGSSRPATEPKTGPTAGYVVIPFSLTAGTALGGRVTLSTLEIVGQVRAPAGSKTTSSLNSFYGAFFNPTGTGTGTLNGATQVSGTSFFQFDTTPLQSIGNPSVGSSNNKVISGNVSGLNLNTGATYWLVLAPKAGLGATAADEPNLLTLGAIANRTSTQVTNSGTVLNTGFGTVAQGKWSTNGGSGALTNAATSGGTVQYFGVRMTGTAAAAVPGPSALLTALMGAVPAASVLMRRRKSR